MCETINFMHCDKIYYAKLHAQDNFSWHYVVLVCTAVQIRTGNVRHKWFVDQNQYNPFACSDPIYFSMSTARLIEYLNCSHHGFSNEITDGLKPLCVCAYIFFLFLLSMYHVCTLAPYFFFFFYLTHQIIFRLELYIS